MTQAQFYDLNLHALEPLRARWERSRAFERSHTQVVRVAVLRALSRHFHSERSIIKVQPLTEPTEQTLSLLEKQVDQLSQSRDLTELSFDQIMSHPPGPSEALTDEILHAPLVLQSALGRPDRRWERRLFFFAKQAGWIPHCMEVTLSLSEIGRFHAQIETDQDEIGVCLWVDASGVSAPQGQWSGRWWWMLTKSASAELPSLGVKAHWTRIETPA